MFVNKEMEAAQMTAASARNKKITLDGVANIDESKLPKFKQVGKIDIDDKKNEETAESKAKIVDQNTICSCEEEKQKNIRKMIDLSIKKEF